MFLIVGLGNPGPQYSMNRHNIGFMCADLWLKSIDTGHSNSDYRTEHKALTKKIKFKANNQDYEVLVAKPQTYMNKSGESVLALLNFYKIDKKNMLVIQDDIDQPLGSMKIQYNRGHGGQNGIRNISELLGNSEYHRLKLGVGRPSHPGYDIADYVLGNFPKEELNLLPNFLERATEAITSFILDGASKAATKYNGQG